MIRRACSRRISTRASGRSPPDLEPEEELLSYFDELKKFMASVARRGHDLLVFIS
jgi:hypothetical protein